MSGVGRRGLIPADEMRRSDLREAGGGRRATGDGAVPRAALWRAIFRLRTIRRVGRRRGGVARVGKSSAQKGGGGNLADVYRETRGPGVRGAASRPRDRRE